jgi:hypothetical protein
MTFQVSAPLEAFVLADDGRHAAKIDNPYIALADLDSRKVKLSNNVVFVIPQGVSDANFDMRPLEAYADGRDWEVWGRRLSATWSLVSSDSGLGLLLLFIPPIALFALGLPLVWVLSGFQRARGLTAKAAIRSDKHEGEHW